MNRRMYSSTFVAALLLLSTATPALAQLHECNGMWTNKPCDGSVSNTIGAKESNAPDDPARAEKRSLLHELTMRSIKAHEQYDIRTDLAPAEKKCLTEPAPLDECRAAVKQVDEDLDRKIDAASTVAERKKANELRDEANRLQRERNRIEEEKSNVVVVERRPLIIIPRPSPRPQYIPGSGLGVSASGSYGGATITINPNGHEGQFSQGQPLAPPPQNPLRPGAKPQPSPALHR